MEKNIKQLEVIFDNFFKEMKIDKNTGVVSDTNKRFVTKPAIGKNYFKSERKVLFVSLDVGKDELFVKRVSMHINRLKVEQNLFAIVDLQILICQVFMVFHCIYKRKK